MNNNMNKKSLKKLSKSQLINMLLEQVRSKKPNVDIASLLNVDITSKKPSVIAPVPQLRYKTVITPIPKPRKSVNQMVKEYEENIILPPLEFRDDYKLRKPVALPRTKIVKTKQALK